MDKQPKILIADDSLFMRKIIADAVKKAGFTNLIEAENGKEAVEKYKTEKPDLILMDLIMPEMNGIEVLKQLVPQKAKIIVISAMGQESIINQALKIGAKGYFIKPFFVYEEIGERIKMALEGEKFSISDIEMAEIKKLEPIAEIGASKAADSFKSITKETVDIETNKIDIIDLEEEIENIKKSNKKLIITAAGILTDSPGLAVLIISEEEAKILVDLLGHKNFSKEEIFRSEIEQSAIKEVLNILANSYISAFNKVNAKMFIVGVPKIIKLNELNNLFVRFLRMDELPRPQRMIVLKTSFNIAKYKIVADLMFLFRETLIKAKIVNRV